MFEIACGQRAEVRALASAHVARYGADALSLARMARADVVERGRHARAVLYDEAIGLLDLRNGSDQHLNATSHKMRMTFSGMWQMAADPHHQPHQQYRPKLLQMLPS
ncbi:hypothetical protein [uncultured Sphingomonas sp.]|uniref:hypothetical protein n=1 Tax=uncultured Sphingomonas sp. TaxID=158754 RepID=UPI0025D16E0C|nr:hypothetical protein [uncultured Sphingomonas sp.]